MDPVLDKVLESVVVVATLCVLLASFFFERTDRRRKWFHGIFGVLAALSVANYFNFGQFLLKGQHVHHHEQFHFFLGSKYLKELRYDAIYDAAILAESEAGRLKLSARRRDPMTFGMQSRRIPRIRVIEIQDRFTPERWREFRKDVAFFRGAEKFRIRRALLDHGNTGSPAWAATASLFTRNLALDRTSAHVFAYLDVLLLLILFMTVWRTFGGRALALTMIVGLSVPLVYRYLGGSILRMDWLVALGMSVCLFEKRHFRTAGIFLGYAVASKLLAGVMVLPLGLRFLVEAVRERRVDRDALRYMLFAVAGLVLFVLISAAYFADAALWPDYARRLATTFQEQYYAINHSFRDLFLQAVHHPGSVWSPLPQPIAASDYRVFISDLRGGFTVAQLVLLAGLVIIAVRHPRRTAFALGPLAVFVLLVTNRYYWQMWMIAAMVLAPTYRRDWRQLGFLAAILGWIGAGRILQLTEFKVKGGYFGSYGMLWIGAALAGFELVSWYRRRRARAPGPESGREAPDLGHEKAEG
jgi:hypothetical protein